MLYQMTAKMSQESRKEAANPNSVHDQGQSIIEMKKSFRYLYRRIYPSGTYTGE